MLHNRFTVPFRSLEARLQPLNEYPHCFRIPKGHHYGLFPKPQKFWTQQTDLHFQFTLHTSCLYDLSQNGQWDEHAQAAINKIVGISRGPHKWNSARIGWRRSYEGEKLLNSFDIFLYCYLRTKRTSHFLFRVEPEEPIRGTIFFRPEGYGMTVPAKETDAFFPFKNRLKGGFLLYPFFGGRYPAPHDMKMEVQTSLVASDIFHEPQESVLV